MISVVIPLYNKAHTIVDTLHTVMLQTFSDFEVIIVNDGSTDNGVEVVTQNFKDSRLRIINQENQGVSVARDRGVEEARSNYIAFLDADDKWHPEYLEIMNNAILDHPDAALFISGGLVTNSNGTISYRLSNKYLNQSVRVDFFENPFLFCHTSGTIINKESFRQTDGSPKGMRCLEDFALFMQLAIAGSVVYIDLPISKYVGGIPGQTTSADEEQRYALMKYVVFFYNFIYSKKRNGISKSFDLWFKYDIRHRMKVFMRTRNYRSLDFLISNLSEDVLGLFTRQELFMYRRKLRCLSIIWVNISKVIWRLHRFPVIGEKVDINRIESKYLNW